jgi:hypothetical protein
MAETTKKVVIGFCNGKDYTVAFSYKGVRITLWNKGDVIKDREGNPIIDNVFLQKEYKELGIEPIVKEVAVLPPVVEAAKQATTFRTEVPPTPTPAPPAPTPLPAPEPPVIPQPKPVSDEPTPQGRSLEFIEKKNIPEADLSDPRKLVVILEGTTWRFLLNNYTNSNPAGVKAHIRGTFGKDFLEKVRFES